MATTLRRNVAIAIAAFMVLEALAVNVLALGVHRPGPLALGLAIDMTLFCALGWIALGRPKPRASIVARGFVFGLVGGVAIVRLRGVPLPGALAFVPLAIEIGLGVWLVHRIVRGREVDHPLARVLATELGALAAAARWIARRPIPTAPAGAFTYATTGAGSVSLALALMIAVEAIPLHFLVPGVAKWIVLGLHVYALVWIAGDARAMRETWHHVESGALVIALGVRWRGRVPLSSIDSVSCEAAPEPSSRGEPCVTPHERPNVVLRLREPVTLRTVFGIPRTARTIRLYVDDPDRFIRAFGS